MHRRDCNAPLKYTIIGSDLILSVDGRRVEDMSLEEIYSMIEGPPGTKVLMCISDGGKARRYVSLTRQGVTNRNRVDEAEANVSSSNAMLSSGGAEEKAAEGLNESASSLNVSTASSMGSVNPDIDRQRRQNNAIRVVPVLNLSAISQNQQSQNQDQRELSPSTAVPPENPKKSQDLGRDEERSQGSLSERRVASELPTPAYSSSSAGMLPEGSALSMVQSGHLAAEATQASSLSQQATPRTAAPIQLSMDGLPDPKLMSP
jgi:hypothetical protein